MQTNFERRCWAEVHLDRLENNFKLIRQAVAPSAEIIAVIKANGYGHGDIAVATTLCAAGAKQFAVANITEALRLRQAGITQPLLILGASPEDKAALLAQYNITQCVFSLEYAQKLSAQAAANGVTINVHLKADTGLGRLGFNAKTNLSQAVEEMAEACSLPGLSPQGIFTHFASSGMGDEKSKSFTGQQFTLLETVRSRLLEKGIAFPFSHCCNSGGILNWPAFHMDGVRPGILLYGLAPENDLTLGGLAPVMALRASISLVKEISAGDCISYGSTFCATKPMRVATISAGYADGYPRLLSNIGMVGVNGVPAPVLGRVCMDQFVIDVSHIDNIFAGDTVTLLGSDGADTWEQAAEKCGTIGYELLCDVGLRVPRVYLQNQKVVRVENYLPEENME